LKNLLQIADEKDLKVAKNSLKLITERGFNQEKDLQERLKFMEKTYKVGKRH